MKRGKCIDGRIIAMLNEAEARAKTADHSIRDGAEAMSYDSHSEDLAGLDGFGEKRLRELEIENEKLRRALTSLTRKNL